VWIACKPSSDTTGVQDLSPDKWSVLVGRSSDCTQD
jgi:hypothetical protein